MVTWDESKRKGNIRDHGIDFANCGTIFDSPLITQEDTRYAYDEQRLQSLGLLGERVVFMVWVERETGPHLVSVRKAENYEQRYYIENLRRLGY